MKLVIERDQPGKQPAPSDEVRGVGLMLLELVTGMRPNAEDGDSLNRQLDLVSPSLRPILARVVLPKGETPLDLPDLIRLLQQARHTRTLQEILDSEMHLRLTDAVYYAIQLCDQLEKDHGDKIGHQNLVAENVILQPGRDREIAQWVSHQRQGQMPESDLLAERQRDVQAIGRLLYAMLTRRAPPPPPVQVSLLEAASAWARLGLDKLVLKALNAGLDPFADVALLRERLFQNQNYGRAIEEIDTLIRASYPIIYVTAWEEPRVLRALSVIAQLQEKTLCIWSLTAGWLDERGQVLSETSKRNPVAALEYILSSHVENRLYVLLDLHPFLEDLPLNAGVRRALRETAHQIKRTHTPIVLVSPIEQVPPDLANEITLVSFPMPTIGEYGEVIDKTMQVISQSGGRIELTPSDYEELTRGVVGLTLKETERACMLAFVQKDTEQGERVFNHDAVEVIQHEKERAVHRSGALEIYSSPDKFSDIGGLEVLKSWFMKRAKAFTVAAQDFGVPVPKGVLLVGVAGCGKSLAAKALASAWKKPLLRLDAGAIFSSRVGASEENLRNALEIAEAIAPSVLWIDEIEKGFSGTSSENDGGVTARVFGGLITWLEEKTAPVFVIATANNIGDTGGSARGGGYQRMRGLPPELLRRGRFDEIFFVDLPNRSERMEIFKVHLEKRGYDSSAYNLEELADASENRSGAEIEQAVLDALYDAFANANQLYLPFRDNLARLGQEFREEADRYSAEEQEQALEVVQAERAAQLGLSVESDSLTTENVNPKAVDFVRRALDAIEQATSRLFLEQLADNPTQFVLTQEMLLNSVKDTPSLYQMRQPEIESLRQWGKNHARPASRPGSTASVRPGEEKMKPLWAEPRR